MNPQLPLNAAWCVTLWLTAITAAVLLLGRRAAVIRRAACRLGLIGVPAVILAAVGYSLHAPSAGLWGLPAPTEQPATEPASRLWRAPPGAAAVAVKPPAGAEAPGPVAVAPPARHAGPAGPSDALAPAPTNLLQGRHLAAVEEVSMASSPPTRIANAAGGRTIEAPPWRWAVWLVAAVSAALALHLLVGLARLAWWRRSWRPAGQAWTAVTARLAKRIGLRRRFAVMSAPGLSAPAATGVIRPAIALPQRKSVNNLAPGLRGVLTHELGHLAGRDPAWQIVSRAVAAVAWWCPLTWWLCRRERIESELTADDTALAGGARPASLAETLVAFAERTQAPAAPVGASGMACP